MLNVNADYVKPSTRIAHSGAASAAKKIEKARFCHFEVKQELSNIGEDVQHTLG
jgi:hypothetical protein